MKKIILFLGLASLLTVGVNKVSASSPSRTIKTSAASVITDPELDLGVVLESTPASTQWGLFEGYFDFPTNMDLSAGDCLMIRFSYQNSGNTSTYFNIRPCFNGKRATVYVDNSKYSDPNLDLVTCVWSNGVQTLFGPTADQPKNRYGNPQLTMPYADGWLCIKKSDFVRNEWNSEPILTTDWANTNSMWWQFYGLESDGLGNNFTQIIKIGDIAVGNFNTGEVLTKWWDWSLKPSDAANATQGATYGLGPTSQLNVSAPHYELRAAQKVYNALGSVDTCNPDSCQSFYTQYQNDISNLLLSDNAYTYFSTLTLNDYAEGDVYHEVGKVKSYSALDKLMAVINATNPVSQSSVSMLIKRDESITGLIFIGVISLLGISALFVFKKKKLSK